MAEIKKISTELQLLDKFLDTSGDAGTSGQVLTSTGTGINWVSGGSLPGGPYLPLAGGTMTGDLKLNDAVVAKFGTGDDLRIQHTGNQSYIQNYTGDLQIQNRAADKDILFRADDGSGVVTSYLVLDGSTTHAYFSNPGNVGIGTTNPGEKLQVNSGNIKIEGGAASSIRGLIIAHTGQTGNQTLLVQNSTNSFGHLYTTERALRIEAGADGGTGTGETLDFWVNGSERMMINTSGNVGIGDSPSFKLDVNVTSNRARFKATSGDANIELSSIAGHDWLIQSKSDSSLAIYDEDESSERMRISSNGSVGINSTSSSYKLDVGGNARFLDSVYVNTSTGSGGLFVTRLGGASESLKIYTTDTSSYLDVYQDENQSGYGNLAFRADDTGNNNGYLWFGHRSGGEAMRIIDNGNVGIGATGPTGKLEVQRSQVTTQFDRDCFLRLHPSATTNSGGYTNMFFGTSPVNNYGVAIGGSREGSDGTPSFSIRMLDDSITGIEVLNINATGTVKFPTYGAGTLVSDASGNITVSSGGGAGGPYLPLAGSVYDGSTGSWSNGITGNLALVSTSGTKGIQIGDDDNGAGQLAVQFNSNNGGGILSNNGGNLEITAQNYGDGSDIIFKGNDTSNNIVTYFQTVGASQKVRFLDNIKLTIGNGDDLKIYHDGSNSYIDETGTGSLYIKSAGAIRLQSDTGENMIYAVNNGAVNLYYNNSNKLQTTNTGFEVTGNIDLADGATRSIIGPTNSNLIIEAKPNQAAEGLFLQINGTDKLSILQDGNATFAGKIRVADGSKATPSYSFTSDTNTGMYSDAADTIKFTVGGTDTLAMNSSNNVGIGTNAPDVKFHVTKNEDGSGLDKGTAKFINTNTGQGATTMHMVQTSSSNFANAVKFWQGSTPTAVGFIRLTTSSTLFITSASDLNLKKNITIWSDDTLGKFKALEPKKFRFKTQDVSEDKTLGFIAQNEVDNFPEAYPQFLGDDEKPYYGFNPTGMVPHLMKAIKDLVEKVEILENKITQLENNN